MSRRSRPTLNTTRVAHRRALLWSVLCLPLLILGCGDQSGPARDVRLESGLLPESPVREADPGSAEPIRFAYASVLSPARSTLAYANLGQYLGDRLGRPVEIVRRRTYAELNELLRSGEAQAGLVCTGAFASGQDGWGLEAIAIPVIGGERTYRSYVIARKDSGLLDFEDLRGRTFAFTDPLSNTGFRYVAEILHDRGMAPVDFFGSLIFTYSHDNSIEAVLDGLADAGSVDSLVWDELVRRDPSLLHELTIIQRSEPFPINPVAVGPDADPVFRGALTGVLLRMADDPEGRLILADLGTDAMVAPDAATLEGYRRIAASWRKLAGPQGPGGGGG